MYNKLLRSLLRLHRINGMYEIPLTDEIRLGTIIYTFDKVLVWKEENFLKKIKTLLFLGYTPSDYILARFLKESFKKDYFGEYLDFSESIKEILFWHYSLPSEVNDLNDLDKVYIKGLESSCLLTRNHFSKHNLSSVFNLSLFKYYPNICLLTAAMVPKFPVRSIKNHVDFDFYFSINELRKSNHPCSNELIRIIYDLILVQHKTSLCRLELFNTISQINKSNAILTINDSKAIIIFDILITYLKATIEKATSLIGHIFEIKDLDSKGKHKARMNVLKMKIPESVKEQFYWDFIMEQLDYEKLEPLNNFRTGLLHKKGISKSQPHSLIEDTENENLNEFYSFITEQHRNNTAMLICVFAILTDNLVNLDPPKYLPSDIPLNETLKYIQTLHMQH